MIDPKVEKPLSLAEAAKLSILPRGRGGRPPSVQTLIRWCQQGYRGILLESIRFGGTLCTTEQAIVRFAERCTTPNAPKNQPMPSDRRRNHQRAKELLDAAGIK